MGAQRTAADRDAWVRRGYEILLSRGAASVTVEGLARTMGVTKGSFYWHFTGRDDLLAAVLHRWTRERTTEVIRAADEGTGGSPEAALRAVFESVGGPRPGEAAMYSPAVDQHPLVSAALAEVTTTRVGYLSGLLERLGLTAQEADDRARLALALAVGHQALDQALPGHHPDGAARRRMTALALRLFRPTDGRT